MTSKTKQECTDFLATLPAPPAGCGLSSLHAVPDPDGPGHYFVVGAKHVGHAADHFSGMLRDACLDDCEKHGIYCEHKEKQHGSRCQVSYKDHKTMMTLFITVPQNKDLGNIVGLAEYLKQINPGCQEFGVQGYAFPINHGTT